MWDGSHCHQLGGRQNTAVARLEIPSFEGLSYRARSERLGAVTDPSHLDVWELLERSVVATEAAAAPDASSGEIIRA